MRPTRQPSAAPVNPDHRFVRFHRLTDRGFVEFAFGIGSRDLMVDLVLPLKAFHEFCRTNRVVYLTREEGDALDFEQAKWKYGKAGITE